MENVKQQAKNPVVALIFGLVVGALFGLVVLGWWLLPVEWTDANTADLRMDAKVAYLRNCIDAYGYNGDAARANTCYTSLGSDASAALTVIVKDPMTQDPRLVGGFSNIVLDQSALPPQEVEVQAPTEITSLPGEETASSGSSSTYVYIICIGLLFVVGAVAAYFYFRNRGRQDTEQVSNETTQNVAPPETKPVQQARQPVDIPAISQSMASYQLGKDLFDEVFSIESGGEFLGEYGVAIADSTGVGSPKKVTALEVWLFDKSDIPTTTKVLMSEGAFADVNRKQRLETKGELVVVSPGSQVVLQTNSLQMWVSVVNMELGDGPPGNYFERITLDMKVWKI